MNNDISQKLRLAIKSKLTTLDAYIDDEVGFQYSYWALYRLHPIYNVRPGFFIHDLSDDTNALGLSSLILRS